MQKTNLNTLIPAIMCVCGLVASAFGWKYDPNAVEPIVCGVVFLVGTIWGVYTNHKQPSFPTPVVSENKMSDPNLKSPMLP